MADLGTRYLGMELGSPLVASSSPLTGSLEGLRRLEAAGAGAVVLPSLFEEDLAEEARQVDTLLATGATAAEARAGHPAQAGYGAGPAASPVSPLQRPRVTLRRAAAASFAICSIYGFFTAGTFLACEDPLAPADAIFVLAGTLIERPLEASDLYAAGYAPRIASTFEALTARPL